MPKNKKKILDNLHSAQTHLRQILELENISEEKVGNLRENINNVLEILLDVHENIFNMDQGISNKH